jgi:rRNA maturation endonuclease Nob1
MAMKPSNFARAQAIIVWFTECGNVFTFDEGGPEENKAKFCQYCGGRLIPIREKESER